jgi:hypothetical protein
LKEKNFKVGQCYGLTYRKLENVKVYFPTTNMKNNDEDIFGYNLNNVKLTTTTTTTNNITDLQKGKSKNNAKFTTSVKNVNNTRL